MALSARHRVSIQRSLVPILGDEEAEAMVAAFPAYEGDELVTRDFLRAELAARFRRQTAWTASTMIAGLGLAGLIARIGG